MTNDLRLGIEEVLRKDIESGVNVLKSPYGVFRKPTRIDVTEASLVGPYFNKLRPEDDYDGTLDFYLDGVKNLNNYIQSQFRLKGKRWFIPDLKVMIPEKEEDYFNLKLPNFFKNPLIEIKPVRDLGYLYQIDGSVFHSVVLPIGETYIFSGGNVELSEKEIYKFDFNNFIYKYSRIIYSNNQPHELEIKGIKKNGFVEAKFNIDFSRYPIILNLDMENKHNLLQKYACLMHQVLSTQLEPFAEMHMIKECQKIGYNITQEQFKRISEIEKKDLNVITTAIVKEFLYVQKIFDKGEIDNLDSKIDDENLGNLALNQIGLKGPFESIDFYSSYRWNLEDFLKGNF
ncbi:MAG: hypothetical protein WC867_00160 [Candidatus Pacearchaeota archaeon]|jgi:hypothetical protein